MQTYTPPPGYYDLPFIWAFDASQLTDGVTYKNNLIYIQGGYGPFIHRRTVGLSRCLDPATGQYQTRDAQLNDLQSLPVFAVSADDIGILPESVYPETGGIRFDLYNILRPAGQTSTAQIAFQGVRRVQGPRPPYPGYVAFPKTFTYTMKVTVGALGTVVTGMVPIDNYDFELYQIIIVNNGEGTLASGPVSSLWLYDQNKIKISNMPILDLYMDGGPGSVYQNGAVVTPLWYRKDSQIQIDFTSQVAGPVDVIVYLVGRKYYPGDRPDWCCNEHVIPKLAEGWKQNVPVP